MSQKLSEQSSSAGITTILADYLDIKKTRELIAQKYY